ncbi:glucagon receptor isoform X2 [Pelobates fuscus]|uniref:glucagon receptor isoform X2 n=1 Tax=Pelobates fuscus TaxID=191477 RepID=UPI002FE46B70
MPHPLLLRLLWVLVMQWQVSSAQLSDQVLESWKKYDNECKLNMSLVPPPTDLVCNRTFDKFACWPDTLPNTTVNMSCPWYLPWYKKVQHGFVYKICGPDGHWQPKVNGQLNRDARECERDINDQNPQERYGKVYDSFKIMYTVGYSVSLGSLILALAILVGFSKLHCMRNYIHINLFSSFILRAVSVLVNDSLLKNIYTEILDDNSVQHWSDNEAGCQATTVLMHYGIIANYCWLLVEGIYLHNLLVLAVFSERSYFALYVCIGWGAPVLFIIPWVVMKYMYENKACWTQNDNMAYWWILRSPVFVTILINFVIFVRIIQILVSKMRAHQMRLARSTLTLIPLLGINELVFAFATDENVKGTLRMVKLFFDLFLSSFQGMLVAVLYCFVNKEVQSELLKKWKRWKLGKDIEDEYKHTNSQTPRPGMGSMCEKYKLVGTCTNGTGKSKHGSSQRDHEKISSITENITLSDRRFSYDDPDSAENVL